MSIVVAKWLRFNCLAASAAGRGMQISLKNQRRWRHTKWEGEEAVDFFEEAMNAGEERAAEKQVAEEQGLCASQERSSSAVTGARERVVWCVDVCDTYGELAFSLNALKQSGMQLLPYDVPHIFKRIQEPSRALTFYRWVRSEPTLTVASEAYDVLVKLLCQRKQFGTVWSVLGDMKKDKPAVPDFIFMTIITNCCSKADSPTEAARFFNSMLHYRCKPSEPLYNCLIEGFLRCSATKLAQKYVGKMTEERFNVSEKNQQLLATTIVKSELQALCDRLLAKEVPVSTPELCCDTVCKLCAAHDLDRAFALFKFMACEGLQPTSQVYETLTRSLAQAERSADALAAFKLLLRMNDRPTLSTCVWLASSLTMDLELRKAYRLSRYLRPSSVRHKFEFFVGRLTHATLMKAVWDLLRFMKYSGYQPDRATYRVCVKAANAGVRRYISIRDVTRAGGSSMTFPCNLLLKMLAWSNHRYAWSFVRFMQSKNVRPNAYTYSRLIQTYYKAEKMEFGWEAYAEMRRHNMFPFRWAYPYLVSDAATTGNGELAVELFEEMIEKWGIPTPLSSKRLIVWLCYRGSSDVALKVYRELKARGAVLKSSLKMMRCLSRVKTVWTLELLNEIDEDVIHTNLIKSGALVMDGQDSLH